MTSQTGYLKLLVTCPLDVEIKRVACIETFSPESVNRALIYDNDVKISGRNIILKLKCMMENDAETLMKES